MNAITQAIQAAVQQIQAAISSVGDFLSKNQAVFFRLGGGQWFQGFAKNISKGLGGFKARLDSAITGRPHLTSGQNFARGAELLTTAPFQMMFDPLFALSFGLSVVDMIVGNLSGRGTHIEFVKGGWLVRDSVIGGSLGGAFSTGAAAFIGHGETNYVIAHEMGHMAQYQSMGGWGLLFGGGMNRFFNPQSSNSSWIENDADLRAWTADYARQRNDLSAIYAANRGGDVGTNFLNFLFFLEILQ